MIREKLFLKKYLYLFLFMIFFLVQGNVVFALDCSEYLEGSGTTEDPYVISSPIELYSISCNMDKNFILGSDIDLTYDTTDENGLFYNGGTGWKSIGDWSSNVVFTGIFDGNGKKITGMYQKIILGTNRVSGGLFGNVVGEIKDLTLEDINIIYEETDKALNWSTDIGGLVSNFQGKISNVHVSGSINGVLSQKCSVNLSGIAARVENSTIENSISDVDIEVLPSNENFTYSIDVGGIVGSIYNTKVDNCINKGNLTGFSVGGIANIVAQNSQIMNSKNYGTLETVASNCAGGLTTSLQSDAVIKNSANYGTIISSETAGGLMCYTMIDDSEITALVENSFNVGSIFASGSAGGIANNAYKTIIKNSFNAGNIFITGNPNDSYSYQRLFGGISGNSAEKLINVYNAGMIFNLNNLNDDINSHFGELLGAHYAENDLIIENAYYLTPSYKLLLYNCGDNCFNLRQLYGTGLNISNSLKKSSYTGFDFDNVWNFDKNSSYPFPQLIDNPVEGNYVKDVTITNDLSNITVKDTVQLKVSVLPDDIVNKDVVWQIENLTGSATLTDEGVLTATESGTVKVSAFSKNIGAIYDEVEINILPIFVSNIEIVGNDIIDIDDTFKYQAVVTPEDAQNKDVVWSIENKTGKGIISEDGELTPVSSGTVIIRATSTDGSNVYSEKEILLTQYVDRINIEANSKYLGYGESVYLRAVISPSNVVVKDIKWSSSDISIASVNETTGGLTTKYKSGEVKIRATSKDGSNVYGEITLTVGNNTYITVGEVTNVSNSFPTSYETEWKIWDKSIVSETGKYGSSCINNNCKYSVEIKGLKNGHTKLDLLTISGDVIATGNVLVYTPIKGLKNDIESYLLVSGEEKQLNIMYDSDDITEELKEIYYFSENELVASVDDTGKIIANGVGKTNIIVASIYGNVEIKVPVEVIIPASDIVIDSDSVWLDKDIPHHQINYSVSPENATYKNVIFSTEDKTIAVVTDTGLIKATGVGSTYINIQSYDGKINKKMLVFVSDFIAVNEVDITEEEIIIYKDSKETTKLEYKILPEDASWIEFYWEVEDSSIVSVDKDGNITPLKTGTTKVYLRTLNGIFDSVSVVVSEKITSIDIISEYEGKDVGSTIKEDEYLETVYLKVVPEDISDEEIRWVSSDDEIIKIVPVSSDNTNYNYAAKLYMGSKIGEVTISAIGQDETVFDSIKINVLRHVDKVTLKNNSATLLTEEPFLIEYVDLPQDYDISHIEFEVINSNGTLVSYGLSNSKDTIYIITEGSFEVIIRSSFLNVSSDIAKLNLQVFNYLAPSFTNVGGRVDTSKKIISNLRLAMKAGDLFNLITNNQDVILYSSDGTIIYTKLSSSEEYLKTGDYLEYLDESDNLIRFYISFRGDLTGDGEVDSLDLATMMNHISGKRELEGVYKESSYLNDDDEIDSLDLAYLMNQIAGKEGY